MPSLHQRACTQKQRERQAQIDALQAAKFSGPLSDDEKKIHALSLARLVQDCNAGTVVPSDILSAYGKKTLSAHHLTNCITDFMFEEALQIPAFDDSNVSGAVGLSFNSKRDSESALLLGVPVSLKDTVNVAGHDTTVGLSRNANCPVAESAPLVHLLQDAGAILHAKTTVPTVLISTETESDLFGRTVNPYNSKHSVGASTGGGAALLACGGSKVEIATDIGGSARVPAHFCGVWGLKGSAGRFPSWGTISSLPGFEGVPIIAAPMAASLADLEEFWKRIILMQPWTYDFTCIPLPWRTVDFQVERRKLKWGVIWDDGVCETTPACSRSLSLVVDALRANGHEVVDFTPPNVSELLAIGFQLIFADGGTQMRDAGLPGETINTPLRGTLGSFAIPEWFKKFLGWIYRGTDPFYASLLESLHYKSIVQERSLVTHRDAIRDQWHTAWTQANLDFVLTVPHPLPAPENGVGDTTALLSMGYTFLFNILDYTAGVLPVTFVDREQDALAPEFLSSSRFKQMNRVTRCVYSMYDADKMHGLPVGVQVVGRRLEEEKVLEGMKVVELALQEAGIPFVPKVLV
ncbi:amidase signature domain-containing protein [Favolaschia claudopus]|uniref:Amidase signature domain-containing protein n=1 Tax=Favolaschia claudopus TaxID=2862362 RepID=A0AAW0D4V0_9AGAR